MLKIKNWKRNRSFTIGYLLACRFVLLGGKCRSKKKLTYERTESIAVIKFMSVITKAHPYKFSQAIKASSIAPIALYMQYLCVVGNDSKNTEEGYSWIKVKKKYLWQSKKTKSVAMI